MASFKAPEPTPPGPGGVDGHDPGQVGGHDPGARPLEFVVDRRRAVTGIVVVCLLVTALLTLLDYAVNLSRGSEIDAIRRLFNMTREDSLASWFSVTVTLLTALTAWLTVAVVRGSGSRARTAGWLALAIFLTWMAIDDGAEVHERLGTAFDDMREEAYFSGRTNILIQAAERFPSYAWQFLLLPMFALMGAFTVVFLWRELPEPLSKKLAAAAILCFALAVGLDFVEGLDPSHPWNLQVRLVQRFDLTEFTLREFGSSPLATVRHFAKVMEEAIEITGITILWAVLVSNLGRMAADARIRVTVHT